MTCQCVPSQVMRTSASRALGPGPCSCDETAVMPTVLSCHAACPGTETPHATRSAPGEPATSDGVAVHRCRQSWLGNRQGCTPGETAHGSDHVMVASNVYWRVARSVDCAYSMRAPEGGGPGARYGSPGWISAPPATVSRSAIAAPNADPRPGGTRASDSRCCTTY